MSWDEERAGRALRAGLDRVDTPGSRIEVDRKTILPSGDPAPASASSTRRVLPPPASASISSRSGRPADTIARNRVSSASSASRPTKGAATSRPAWETSRTPPIRKPRTVSAFPLSVMGGPSSASK